MSLAQRRTEPEGIDWAPGLETSPSSDDVDGTASPTHVAEERRASVISTLSQGPKEGGEMWRTISYDPFSIPELEHYESFPVEASDNITTYEIHMVKRAAQVTFAVLACVLASGIVCGFAALKPVLIAEGVYHDLCPPDWPGPDDDAGHLPCTEQDMRLNIFFISASITLNVSTVFAGYLLDNYGRRICYLLAALILLLGSMLIGAAFTTVCDSLPLDCYVAGNMLLGLGGTFLFVSSYQLANAFPKNSGLIVALITGAFDASASVFLFYRLAYEATDHAFKPAYFFFGFGIVIPLTIILAEFTFMPAQAYNTRRELEKHIERAQDETRDYRDSDDEIDSHGELQRVRSRRARVRKEHLERIENVAGDAGHRQERRNSEWKRQVASGVWGVLHREPLARQVQTPWFLLMLALTVLQMLRMNYFIATVRGQYQYMLGSDKLAEDINHFFDVALPIAGVVSTPLIGLLLNEAGVVFTLGFLTVLIIVLGVLNCLPYVWAGYVTVVAFVFFRPLYYSTVSDYVTKVFGFASFGRIYGATVCISGLTNFIQPVLDLLTHGPMKGSPIPVNIFFAVAGSLISAILAVYVYIQRRDYDIAAVYQQDTEEAQSRLLGNDHEGYGTS